MTSTPLVSQTLLTQSVEFSGTFPQVHTTDFAIPTGDVVAGSGAVITELYVDNAWTPVDSLDQASIAGYAAALRVFDGPHPTDSTKWRVMASMATSDPLRITAWITTVGE